MVDNSKEIGTQEKCWNFLSLVVNLLSCLIASAKKVLFSFLAWVLAGLCEKITKTILADLVGGVNPVDVGAAPINTTESSEVFVEFFVPF